MRQTLLSFWLLAALLAHAGAHVAILVSLFRRGPRYRAAVAFVLPPLAPYYAVAVGFRKLSALWLASLLAYAFGVALANL